MKLTYALIGCLSLLGSLNLHGMDAMPWISGLSGTPDDTDTSFAVDGVYGYSFTVGDTALEVSALGIYDYQADGLLSDHEVGLYTSDGLLVASVSLEAGASSGESFVYVSLSTPIILSADAEYVVAATYLRGTAGDPTAYANDRFCFATFDTTWENVASYGTALFTNETSSLVFPTGQSDSAYGGFIGPNMIVAAVPEPSWTVAAGLAVGLLVLRRVRRRE